MVSEKSKTLATFNKKRFLKWKHRDLWVKIFSIGLYIICYTHVTSWQVSFRYLVLLPWKKKLWCNFQWKLYRGGSRSRKKWSPLFVDFLINQFSWFLVRIKTQICPILFPFLSFLHFRGGGELGPPGFDPGLKLFLLYYLRKSSSKFAFIIWMFYPCNLIAGFNFSLVSEKKTWMPISLKKDI